MKKQVIFILILLTIPCLSFAQNSKFSEFSSNDTVRVFIDKIGSHISYNTIYRLTMIDSSVKIEHFSPHIIGYKFEENSVANYHLEQNKKFLESNNLELDKYYSANELIYDSLENKSFGISTVVESKLMNDSAFICNFDVLEIFKELENKVLNKEIQTLDKVVIAGTRTYFLIFKHSEVQKKLLRKHRMIKHEIKGWYDFDQLKDYYIKNNVSALKTE